MEFEINQKFIGEYPPEAAMWCNENNAFIEELDPTEEGERVFVIKAIPEPTQEEKEQAMVDGFARIVQDMLDEEARKLNYDSCLSVCSYYDTGYEKFDVEGAAFRAWRSAVWVKAYAILDEVKAGTREIPTEEELLAELPALAIEYK